MRSRASSLLRMATFHLCVSKKIERGFKDRVTEQDHPPIYHPFPSVRCRTGIGGGRHRRTRQALLGWRERFNSTTKNLGSRNNDSPLMWHGGKSYLASWIIEHFPGAIGTRTTTNHLRVGCLCYSRTILKESLKRSMISMVICQTFGQYSDLRNALNSFAAGVSVSRSKNEHSKRPRTSSESSLMMMLIPTQRFSSSSRCECHGRV